MNKNHVKEILQLLYPADVKCIICGREIPPNRYGLCEDCSFDINVNYCVRCGRHKVGIGEYCGECANQSLHFDEARSAVVYDEYAKKIIWRLKYGDAKYLASALSEYLLDTLLSTDWKFDCLTFVPIHEKRQKRRGYNQAELLASELADKITSPCIGLLKKTVATPNQARLTREQRSQNLKGAFECIETPPKHVVLIDDVMTTGSTADECARVLKKAGASVVYLLTFASVPERPLTDKPVQNIRDFRR